MDNKQTWQRPELIVLVHGRPEQDVLFFCKNGPPGETSPQEVGGGCQVSGAAPCATCYQLSPS